MGVNGEKIIVSPYFLPKIGVKNHLLFFRNFASKKSMKNGERKQQKMTLKEMKEMARAAYEAKNNRKDVDLSVVNTAANAGISVEHTWRQEVHQETKEEKIEARELQKEIREAERKEAEKNIAKDN